MHRAPPRLHRCDVCKATGAWTAEWARWGTEDHTVFKVCSSTCAAFALPSTRFVGKARGGFLKTEDVARARADLARRLAER